MKSKSLTSIKNFIMLGGERYCLLVYSQSRHPLYYPNLYVTTQIRNASFSHSTMENALLSISILYNFCHVNKISLIERFKTEAFLSIHELDALVDYCRLNFKYASKSKTVNNHNIYNRITHISNYLKWLVNLLNIKITTKQPSYFNNMIRMLNSRRPINRNRNLTLKEKGLSDNDVKILFEIFNTDSNLNPFKNYDIRKRNRLMFLLLFYLGIRSGELLNLRIKDIDFAKQQIIIARRADLKEDPRLNQPLVKTLDRLIPINDTLIKELHNYIINIRRKVPNSNKNDFLFITHKLGKTCGQPISKSSFNKLISLIRATSPQLHNFKAHSIRHKWNENFSALLDSMENPIEEAQQEQIRSWIMGWKQGSGTAVTYNKRFIKQKANQAMLILQNSLLKNVP